MEKGVKKMEEIKATVKTKRDLTEEEMEKVNGG